MPKKKVTKKELPKRTPVKDRPWRVLTFLIQNYAQAAIAESWKSGGDPADVESLELGLKWRRAELNAHIEKMRREFDV